MSGKWRWFWHGFFNAFCLFPRRMDMAEVDAYLAEVEERVRKELSAEAAKARGDGA